MADGLGQDASIDSAWTKRFTIASLLIGMCVALLTTAEGRVPLIFFAQALTVLGGPILVGSLLYLAMRKLDNGSRAASGWMIVVTALGCRVGVSGSDVAQDLFDVEFVRPAHCSIFPLGA